MNDPIHTTDEPQREPDAPTPAPSLPQHIGRFRVERVLGKGGFGLVYLAYDDQLQRLVAIKVPHRERVSRPEDAQAYLTEARTVARLDHPNIVPVYDASSDEQHPVFIVSKYIEGITLAQRIKANRPSLMETVELMATVAETLHYAHRKGLVHRDIKPGNILLDSVGKPFVADFGLALREQDVGRGPRSAGTPTYMSPEQANGEGHRVDGRSDIFSLGVVFYELMTGRRPFRGDSQAEVLERIVSMEVRPPRQWDDSIPKELERICLKALAKRATDRYSTAKDMADDLRHFIEQASEEERQSLRSSVAAAAVPPSAPTATPVPSPAPTPISDSSPIRIVPKGLRSFDAHDADFFLELLPGPRDREGLPDSIRFWKTRIEEADADNAFAVALIYGPSGCGKSSLVKAGLLPRLSDHVLAVYVEAAAVETETRLLNGLRKKCPDLPANLGLKETLTALRQGRAGLRQRPEDFGKKVLIVLDQFEQWLHAKKDEENTELVSALRQCDGVRVQCLVLVRDDFWMAATRFMRQLEIRLLEGHNSAAVDLFDLDHARKVLAAFGRAFGKLPEDAGETDREHKEFLKQAVAGLAQEGKVISVRLALFADMMKGKTWTPASLKAVGGAEGVGVVFLEETFSAATSPPEHRYHQKAARAVLKVLLPEVGTDIKGHMRSHQELLEASGYVNRLKDFDDLLRLLDSEIRLLTPTDPEGKEEQTVSRDAQRSAADGPRSPDTKYYQLTHDYLVPSIRDWLTRKQKETRRGRAELLLADRAAVWNARRESRQLPSLLQWLQIRWLTAKKSWTPPQRKMMGKATRFHALRAAMLAVMLASIGWGVYEGHGRLQAHALRDRLLDANINEMPAIVRDMAPYRRWLDSLLHHAHAQAENDRDHRKQLHLSLALLPGDAAQVEYLYGRLLDAEPLEVAVIRDALAGNKDKMVDRLWAVVEKPEKGKEQQRLGAACALASYDVPDNAQGIERWQSASKIVADELLAAVQKNPSNYATLLEQLRPVRARLLPPLSEVYRSKNRPDSERSFATNILADYAADNPQFLADLLMGADDKQFAVLYPKLQSVQEKGQAVLRAELEIKLQPNWSDPPLDSAWKAVEGQLVRKIEAAHGSVQERFAFCQTMPLEEFLSVVDQLRPSGYRPTRFRPYAVAKGVFVAAVWTRDGREWQMAHGLSADEIRKRDAELRKQSFQPIDANGYESAGKEAYAVLWVKAAADAAPAQLALGLEAEPMDRHTKELQQKGYHKEIYTRLVSSGGTIRFCAIWTKAAAAQTFTEIETDYGGNRGLQVDVQISKAEPIPSTKERYTKQLKETDKLLKSKSNNANARLQRAVAYFNLGDNDKALADLSLVIKQAPQAAAYQYRAFVQARLGKAKEAKSDLTEFQKLNSDPSQGGYTDVVVAAHLGEDEPAVKRLETEIAANAKQAGFLYNAACAFSLASAAVAKKDRAKAKTYADRAAALLKEAISQGYSDYSAMEIDADLDPIRQHPPYAALWKGAALDRRYTSVWHESAVLGSVEEHGSGPAGHLASCKSLMAQGYRPASVSVLELEDGRKTTASVWQRPFVAENDKERLAKRQANAGVALLRMNQPEKVWPLLKHSPDPRVRSYLIHRLSPLGADAGAIVKRLEEEPDITIRRALILSLGEFGDTELSPAARQALMPKLQDIYRTDADPGLHAAAEWLLRIWKQQDWLKQINEEWAKDKEQRSKRLERIGQQLKASRAASVPGASPRQWYVNSQGQTMVVLPGPVEFRMGSPPSEAGRSSHETQHKRRIGRTFALAAAAVTKEQYLKFEVGWSHTEFRRYPEPSCPIGGVIWYQAAAYCNWLSEQEGIPEDQWCYEVQDGQVTKLKANYLSLTGYRLPTEAEMEYATRAGALTSRYYGETEELLPKYAWYLKNSQERTWPVGSLKPNDFGLFDVHGNLYTWCQERYLGYPLKQGEDKEDINSINIQESRVLRGGSFINQSSYVCCATRVVYVPTFRTYNVGLRPARTYR